MIKLANGKIVASKVKVCKSFLSKSRGLMFCKSLKRNHALVLENKKDSIADSSIHMLFVFFPIDVLWVNSENTIVDLHEALKPFALFRKPAKPARFVVELPAGTIKRIASKIGQKVKFY